MAIGRNRNTIKTSNLKATRAELSATERNVVRNWNWVEVLVGAFGRGLLCGSLQKAVQTGATDPQHLRGSHAIAIAHIEHALNVHAADFIER